MTSSAGGPEPGELRLQGTGGTPLMDTRWHCGPLYLLLLLALAIFFLLKRN